MMKFEIMIDDCTKNAINGRKEQLSRDGEEGRITDLPQDVTKMCSNKVTVCEIVTLPGLHQRKPKPMYRPYTGASAHVIEFPAPRWRQNAQARS